MLDKKLQEILVCPKCKGKLEYKLDQEKLMCQNCRLNFEIKENIPILLLDEAEKF